MSLRRRAALISAAAIAGLVLVVLPGSAIAAKSVELIRVYDTDLRGTVFEVCRGHFDPPATDAQNPAYCRGTVLRWSQAQWEAFVAGDSADDPGGPGKGKANGPATAPGAKTPAGVATGLGPEAGGELPTAAVPYGGSLDPTAVLGIENPLCGERGKLSARQVRNCESSASPEAAYPVGNYGWDIHVEPGGFISSLFAPAVSFVLQFLSVFWLVLLLLLKGCLIVLGFTFSLSPFTDNRMLKEIGDGLMAFFNQLTSPWLSTIFVVLGAWGLYSGIVRRRTGETLAGMAMALVMMLGALWVIHAPRDTVGRAAEAVNSASLTAVAAPSAGNLRAPVRSYNDAMSAVWNQMTAIPFCAMNFSDVHWCMTAKPSEEAIDAARDGIDEGDAFSDQILSGLPANPGLATQALSKDLTDIFGSAPTIRDLYLRFSPAGGPRDALWKHYNGEPDDTVGLPLDIGPQLNVGGGSEGEAPDKVAMQGRNGVLTRMVMVVIFTIGLLGGVVLLLWLAMKLVMATASAFILVLAAPLAMFLPAFGQAGRNAFTKWITALLGAIAAKLIYSALLGIVLLGSSVIGLSVGRSSPTLGLLAVMAFWWAVFLSREKFLAVFQVDPVDDRGAGLYRTVAGGYLGYRIAKGAAGAVGNFRAGRLERGQFQIDRASQVRRKSAERELDEQAHRRLDVATAGAEARESARAEKAREITKLQRDPDVQSLKQDGGSGLAAGAQAAATTKLQRLERLQDERHAGKPQEAADRQLLDRVRANEAAGLPRHGKAEVQGAREAIRRELSLPDDSPEHHWRARAVGAEPHSPEGREAISSSLAESRNAVDSVDRDRLDQVSLRRPRRVGGDQRRATAGLRRSEESNLPKPERRSSSRDWLSR